MKTNIFAFDSRTTDYAPALSEVEKCAAYHALSKKSSLQLRLLGEELLGMTRGMLGDFDAEFWIESEKHQFELHLDASTTVDTDKREEILKVSSSGENVATKGFMGKLRRILEIGLYGDGNDPMITMYAGTNPGMMASHCAWSLMSYMDSVKAVKEIKTEEWDELEKSIVANLADDVVVGVRTHSVQITIKKAFPNG